MNFQYYNPVDSYFGEGCIAAHPEVFARYGSRALIVTGHSSRKNGSLDDVLAVLRANDTPWDIYDDIKPNPTVASVRDGAAFARNCGSDFIVAVGGGSPMDTAKGIALLARQDLTDDQLFVASHYTTDVLPMIMVPTTAGTGSEVSEYSVLMDEVRHTKSSISSPVIYPKAAFLDYRYTRGIGRDTTLYPALDALSHSIEGILSKKGDPMITAIALESISVIGACLPELRAFCRGNASDLSDPCREKLLYGAYLGGLVLAHTSTTVVHAMGHSLTFSKNIVHGRANALCLPGYLKFTEGSVPVNDPSASDPAVVRRILAAMGLTSTAEFTEIFDELLGETDHLSESEILEFTAIVSKKRNVPNCLVVPAPADIEYMYRHLAGTR